MLDKLVSVIIPTYNRQETIFAAINSVLEQSYSNLELLIVDDGSTDNTINIISSINDSRIKVYKQDKNRGANYCRNYGISKAAGEYIAFNDSDDIWHTDKLEKCIKKLENSDIDIVFSSFLRIYKNNKDISPEYNLNDFFDKYEKLLLLGNCMSTQTIVAKRQCLLDTPFDNDLPRLQDWDLAIRLVNKYKIYFIEEPLVDTFLQKDSITFKLNDFEAIKKIYEKNAKFIEDNKELKLKFLKLLARTKELKGDSGYVYYSEIYKREKTLANFVKKSLSKAHLYSLLVRSKFYIQKIKFLRK